MKFLWISSNLRAFTRNKVQNYVVDDKQVNFTVFFFFILESFLLSLVTSDTFLQSMSYALNFWSMIIVMLGCGLKCC